LVNAAKHAPHQPVEVRLKYEQGRTALIVANKLCDNAGGQATTFETVNGGRGLPGMRERLLLIDGSLSAGRRDGQWVVSAQVPQ
jgi:signal transduction histidine kinase